MPLVDTNIFLEVTLSQARGKECGVFLNAVQTGKTRAWVTDFSLYSIMIIMASVAKLRELKIFLASLAAYRGLTVYRSRLADLVKAAEISGATGLDIEDAIQYAAALALGAKAIVSYDTHFDGLAIPRRTPMAINLEV